MYKHHKWNKKQLEKQLRCLTQSLSKVITLYKLKDAIKFLDFQKSNIIHITQTINLYEHYHPIEIFSKKSLHLKPFFNKIREYDRLIEIDNIQILYHSYRILFILEQYLGALNSYLTEDFQYNSVALLNGEQVAFLQKSKHYRKEAFLPETFYNRMEIMRSFIFRKFYYYPNAMNHLINLFTLIPIHQFKHLEENIPAITFIKQSIKYFGTTNIQSPKTILKSLAIVLAKYMVEIMQISQSQVLELLDNLFKYYIYDLCEEDNNCLYKLPNSYKELTQNAYIKHRIKLIPIFGNSRDSEVLALDEFKQLNFLFEDFKKEFNITFPEELIKDFNPMKNPVKLYLAQLPLELLQKIE